jgi:hypothetical protein
MWFCLRSEPHYYFKKIWVVIYMVKFVWLLKLFAILITVFIVLNGVMMLVVYGFSLWFCALMLLEVIFLITQFWLLKKKAYNRFLNLAYVLPFPAIFVVTLLG